MDHTQTPLLSQLRACAERDYAPFHTPGHKRGRGLSASMLDLIGTPASLADLPELPELDNLFAPQGVIQEAQILAADAFGADRTWFLVNGSTGGILAAILTVCHPGEKIILPRNVHQSAIAGLIQSGAVPIFIQPDYDTQWDLAHGVTPEAVRSALSLHPDAKAVFIVSPTYHGLCCEIGAIADIVHQVGIPLLVDEAHGPHFAFHPELPDSALSGGADLTVQSTHKVLAGLTQASMLHVQGDRLDPDRLSAALQLVQSSSPNYLLLASLDAARSQMVTQGEALLTQALNLADRARSRLAEIPGIAVLQASDRTRLTVKVSDLGIDGFAADERLHQTWGVTCELPSLQHLTFIVTFGNTVSDIDRLVTGFEQLSKSTQENSHPDATFVVPSVEIPTQILTPRDAFFAPKQTIALSNAIGAISAETICPYPPGIPVLLPGEAITAGAIATVQKIVQLGGFVTGCADPTLKTVRVIADSQ